MPVTQNLRFTATVQKDAEFDHPPGAGLMRGLASALAAEGWSNDEMDNWRDCGWSVGCRRGSSELEIVVSQIQDGQWILQVSPRRRPGLIGSLFGSRPSATATANLGRPQSRWDGFPDEKHSTSEPTAA